MLNRRLRHSYFHGKRDGSDIGRFLTQDSFFGDVTNVPSLHRYYYANQNPLVFVDPTGFQSEAVQEDEEPFDLDAEFRSQNPNFGRNSPSGDTAGVGGSGTPEGEVTEEGLWAGIVRKYNEVHEALAQWGAEEGAARGRTLFDTQPQTEKQRMMREIIESFPEGSVERENFEEASKSFNLNKPIREGAEATGREIGEKAPEEVSWEREPDKRPVEFQD